MDCTLEKECSALGGLFQSIVNDLKGGHPIWEDFAQKATKLQCQLKATISTVNLFLDALQKIADVATAAKGATRDIGTALTRICMRHRSIENRLKTLTSALIDCLVQPLQEKMEEWRRTALQMDKDHSKEYKRCRHEIKKRSMDTVRLQKKVRKGQSSMHRMLESATQEVNDRYMGLLDIEKQAVRQAMIEQRAQYCLFVSWFKPVMDGEISLLNEITQLNEVVDLLCKHSADPYTLPAASEAVIMDVKGLENTWRFQTPPSSPGSSLGSRKSSLCSLSSADSHGSSMKQPQMQQQTNNVIQQRTTTSMRAAEINEKAVLRFSSMSSQDSGFTSQDTLYIMSRTAKSPPRSMLMMDHISVSDEEGSTPGSLDSQQSTPSPSPSSATWPENGTTVVAAAPSSRVPAMTPPLQRPHTISAGYSDTRVVQRRAPLNNMTFVPPRPTSLFKHPQDPAKSDSQRPPMVPNSGKASRAGSRATTPMKSSCTTPNGPKMVPAIPDFNAAQPDQVVPQPIYMNVSDLHQRGGSGDTMTKEQQAMISQQFLANMSQQQQQQIQHGQSRSKRPLSFVGTDDFINLLNSECATPLAYSSMNSVAATPANGSIRDDDEDTVIGECVDQIDQLTSELDKYCALSCPSSIDAYCTLPRSNGRRDNGGFGLQHGSNTIVRRPSSSTSSKPPPPPTRRNSSITAATPNAPAVDFVRTNSRCTTPVDESFNCSANQPPQQQQQHCSSMRYQNGGRAWSETPTSDGGHYFPAPPPPLSSSTAGEDFSVTREILMMQIRGGVRLRSAKDPRDRSMPRI